jgi:hypothetical protein
MGNDDQHGKAPADPEVLAHVDAAKRASLRKLVIGTAYAVPAIASFSLAGLSTSEAATYVSNIPA